MSRFAPNSHTILCREINHQQQQNLWGGFVLVKSRGFSFSGGRKHEEEEMMIRKKNKNIKIRDWRVNGAAFWPDLSRPASVEMEPIEDSDHLDKILDEAKQLSQPIIIDWMASWCRKCIYLKPKLEKLAADYDTKIKFFCVDVNKVPQTLVKRANITKMPTIQLWKDGEMKAEVIGGHKAWLVIEEVRQMIKNFV